MGIFLQCGMHHGKKCIQNCLQLGFSIQEMIWFYFLIHWVHYKYIPDLDFHHFLTHFALCLHSNYVVFPPLNYCPLRVNPQLNYHPVAVHWKLLFLYDQLLMLYLMIHPLKYWQYCHHYQQWKNCIHQYSHFLHCHKECKCHLEIQENSNYYLRKLLLEYVFWVISWL